MKGYCSLPGSPELELQHQMHFSFLSRTPYLVRMGHLTPPDLEPHHQMQFCEVPWTPFFVGVCRRCGQHIQDLADRAFGWWWWWWWSVRYNIKLRIGFLLINHISKKLLFFSLSNLINLLFFLIIFICNFSHIPHSKRQKH